MRMSQLFSQTLREAPADSDIASHQLLLRAGYIRPLAAGIFSYLPLARRAMRKIEQIVREEMDAIGGQEITMPVVHPAEPWQESKRWYQIGPEMGRFQDRSGRDMVLAMTHEEIVSDLVRREIRSYRQLPALIYHFQTKWRDEPRPRAGLIRVREFTMKDSYSLDADWEGLDKQYAAHYSAYFRIYSRCGLSVIAVQSDMGMMGGKLAHEFMYLAPIGEDTLLVCDECGYSANREVATFKKPKAESEALLPMQKVGTPDATTIEALAKFLNVPEAKTAKAVFMVATVTDALTPNPSPSSHRDVSQGRGEVSPVTDEERFVFAVVRGDTDVNEMKLMNAVKAKALRPATEDEIRAIQAVPGYGSPVGITPGTLVVVDDLAAESPNLVAGANEAGYHLLNVNYGRDYQAQIVTDITSAREGDVCPKCGHALRAVRGVEVGNIFKLGTRYSDVMGCTFQDKDGQSKPVIMGSYGIGVGRLLACVAEEHHDDYGLTWPISVTPYEVHLVLLPDSSGKASAAAEQIYVSLRQAGIDVLFDDRDERAGVKFNDADLIGLPARLTVSKKALDAGGVEMKLRQSKDKVIVPVADIVQRVQTEIDRLWAALKVVEMAYKE